MQLSDDFPMILEREANMHESVPKVAVAFGYYPVVDRKKSAVAGHDVYKEVEFVKIAIPGDRNSLFLQPAEESHKRRFPEAYAAFKKRGVTPTEGMPIEQWPAVGSRTTALNLRAMHINTVEALAEVSESHIDKIGSNGRVLRDKARAWLKDAKDGAAVAAAAEREEALQRQIAALQAQINALATNGIKVPAQTAPAAVQAPVAHVAAQPGDIHAGLQDDVVAAVRKARR